MPLTLISLSGEQYRTIKEKMEAIANVSFPTKADDLDEALYPIENSTNNLIPTTMNNGPSLEVCPKLLKRLLRKTKNTSGLGIDGIGWQELKIWFFLDPPGPCDLIDLPIETGLLPELKQARVVVISTPGRRDHTSVKVYRCIQI
jgi:hypothetical protein